MEAETSAKRWAASLLRANDFTVVTDLFCSPIQLVPNFI
jgi:hypothetical protein